MVRRSLVFLSLVIACAGPRPPTLKGHVGDAERQERLRLGHVADARADLAQEIARLRALVAIERRIGNRDEALVAARALAERMHLERGLARAGLSPRAVAEVERLHDEVQGELVALARAMGEPGLVVDAMPTPPPAGAPRARAWITAAASSGRTWGYEGDVLARLAAGSPETQAMLEEVVPAAPGERSLSVEDVVRLGPRWSSLLERRLRSAIDRKDRAATEAVGRALLRVDPWHVDARLAVLAPGRVRNPSPWTARLRQVVELERAASRTVRDPAAVAVLAREYLRQSLPGHAERLLDERPRPTEPFARATWDELRALAALASGDATAYLAWRDAARRGAGSPYLASTELALDGSSAPSSLRALARQAAQRIVAQGWRGDRWTAAWQVVADPVASPALRRAAATILAKDLPLVVRLAERCLSKRLSEKRCHELAGALQWADEEEWDGATLVTVFDALGDAPEFPADWLWMALYDAEALPKVAAVLARLEGTGLALTEEAALVRLAAALAAGDAAGFVRRLAIDGPLLPARSRVAARLAAGDLAARRPLDTATLAKATYPHLWILPDPHHRRGTASSPNQDARSDVARLHAGLTRAQQGDLAGARASLATLVPRLSGAEAAELGAHVGRLALTAGDRAAAARALADAERLAPEAASVVALRAGLAPPAQASAAAAAWLRRAGSSALVELVEVLVARPGGIARARRLLDDVAVRDEPLRAFGRAVDRGAVRDAATARRWLRAVVGDPGAAWNLGPAAAAERSLQRVIDREAEARLERAPDGAAARRIARDALARRAAADATTAVEPEPGLLLVAGDLAAIMSAIPSASRRASATLLAALHARRAPGGLTDEQALAVWRALRAADGNDGGDDGPDPNDPRAALGRELAGPRAIAAEIRLACQLLHKARAHDEALPVCARAWRAPVVVDDELATIVSYHLDQRPLEARAQGLEAERFFAEARRRVPPDDGGTWLHNEAVFLGKTGRHEEAARSALEAIARGYEPAEVGELDLAQAPWRGTTVSLQLAHQGGSNTEADRLLLLASSALHARDGELFVRYAEAAGRWLSPDVPVETRKQALAIRAMARLLAADRGDAALDVAAVAAVFAAFTSADLSLARTTALAATSPRSRLIAALVMEARAQTGDVAGATAAARKLGREHAGNWLVGNALAGLLVHEGAYAEARRVVAALRRENSEDPELIGVRIPEGPDGGGIDPPAEARDARAYARALAAVRRADVDALRPVRHVDVDQGAEAFLPAGTGDPTSLETMAPSDTSLVVKSMPRVSSCEGSACLEILRGGLEQVGARELWSRPVRIPAGAGTEAMFVTRTHVVAFVVVAIGSRVHILSLRAPPGRFGASLPGWSLLRETFRPLDLLLPATRAEALRNEVELPVAERRLAARRALVRPPRAGACPLVRVLDGLREEARGALLLDVYLGLVDPAARRALVGCVEPTAPAAASLALAALLDEDPRLHAFGARAVAAHPDVAVRHARLALLGDEETPLAGTTFGAPDQAPRYGFLEVIDALPEARRAPLVTELIRSARPRERSLGLLAAALTPSTAHRATLRRHLRSGLPHAAHLVAQVLGDAADDDDADAARARADGLRAPLGRPQRALAVALAGLIASRVDARDVRRLRRLADVVEQRVPDGEQADAEEASEHIGWMADVHARALVLAGGGAAATAPHPLDRLAHRVLARRAGAPATARRARTDDELRAPLPELLPGDAWQYARIPAPGLLAAAAQDLHGRLDLGGPVDTLIAKTFLNTVIANAGGGLLVDRAGLDLGRPFECAVPARGPSAFACSAYVKDRDALLESLARSRPDRSPASTLPHQLAMFATGLAATALAPALAHAVLYGERPPPDREVVAERVRGELEVAGRTLTTLRTVVVAENGAHAAAMHVFFVGDRALVFSDRALAEDVLLAPDAAGGRLADAPRFRRLAARWSGGGAVQGVLLDEDDASGEADVAVEATATTSGVTVRLGGSADAKAADVRPLLARLPEGAASRLAFSSGPKGWSEGLRHALAFRRHEAAGTAPPAWLLAPADRVALGWYTRPREALWSRWVAVLDASPAVRRALAENGVRLRRGGGAKRRGVTFALRGDHVLAGVPRALVEETAARPVDAPPAGARRLVWQSDVNGALARRILAELPAPPDRSDAGKWLAAVAGAVGSVTASGWLEGDQLRLEGHVAVPQRTGGALDVIEHSLGSGAVRNAARLPRVVRPAELRRPLRWVIDTDNAAAAARAFPASPRQDVQVVNRRRLVVTVRPEDENPRTRRAPTTLSAAERRRLLASQDAILVDHHDVRDRARALVPAGTPPADAVRRVVGWVHRELRYELTTGRLDAVTVLERRRGDCTEYSVLTVALLRAAGVPTELREGFSVVGGQLVAHAWVAYHDGAVWREIDPTEGLLAVGSGHVRVSVLDFALRASAGQLTVVSVGAP